MSNEIKDLGAMSDRQLAKYMSELSEEERETKTLVKDIEFKIRALKSHIETIAGKNGGSLGTVDETKIKELTYPKIIDHVFNNEPIFELERNSYNVESLYEIDEVLIIVTSYPKDELELEVEIVYWDGIAWYERYKDTHPPSPGVNWYERHNHSINEKMIEFCKNRAANKVIEGALADE